MAVRSACAFFQRDGGPKPSYDFCYLLLASFPGGGGTFKVKGERRPQIRRFGPRFDETIRHNPAALTGATYDIDGGQQFVAR
jgi:hypothetical protein